MAKGKKGSPKKSAGDKSMMVEKTLKRKIKNLERHLKKYPNDEQSSTALNALKKGKYTPRKAPRSSVWTGPRIQHAQFLAMFGYNGHAAAYPKSIHPETNRGDKTEKTNKK